MSGLNCTYLSINYVQSPEKSSRMQLKGAFNTRNVVAWLNEINAQFSISDTGLSQRGKEVKQHLHVFNICILCGVYQTTPTPVQRQNSLFRILPLLFSFAQESTLFMSTTKSQFYVTGVAALGMNKSMSLISWPALFTVQWKRDWNI